AKAELELVALARLVEHFLLGETRSVARKLFLERLQALDRVRDRLPVSEHAAQPAVVDEVLTRSTRRVSDRPLRLALGADEQHLAARSRGRRDEVERTRKKRHGLRQVENVDAAT